MLFLFPVGTCGTAMACASGVYNRGLTNIVITDVQEDEEARTGKASKAAQKRARKKAAAKQAAAGAAAVAAAAASADTSQQQGLPADPQTSAAQLSSSVATAAMEQLRMDEPAAEAMVDVTATPDGQQPAEDWMIRPLSKVGSKGNIL